MVFLPDVRDVRNKHAMLVLANKGEKYVICKTQR